ncbi:hypothetical protein ACH4VR_26825 [Streptomyces sp. NPDC020883]|uniref:hypothetical protein n=1 Tax=Streptomyces sp. NPDC020883 TaxID=3365099 RepID=UPI0037894B9B
MPFIGAAARNPELVAARTVVLVLVVHVFLDTLSFPSALLRCQFRNPVATVPWARMVLVFLGLSVIPFEDSRFLSQLFLPG